MPRPGSPTCDFCHKNDKVCLERISRQGQRTDLLSVGECDGCSSASSPRCLAGPAGSLSEDDGEVMSREVSSKHHGISMEGMFDLPTYSTGIRRMYELQDGSNKLAAESISCRKSVDIIGPLRLLTCSCLCKCEPGDLVVIKKKKDVLWDFAIFQSANYLLPAPTKEDQCEVDVLVWRGRVTTAGAWQKHER